MHIRQLATAAVLLALAHPAAAGAQDSEPLFDQLERTFKHPWLSVGFLVQAVGDFQVDRPGPGPNGFSIGAARLKVSGTLDHGFSYQLQTEAAGGVRLLDARIDYQPSPGLALSAGRYKAPFSGEVLTSAASIDFVNRAAAISALAPGREVGVQVRAGIREAWSLSAGAFNGAGGNTNDNNHLLYTARLAYGDIGTLTGPDPSGLAAGFNAAVSEDDGLTVPGVTPVFSGTRILVGGDVRYAEGSLLLAGEVVYANLDAGLVTVEPWGGHGTVGYMVGERTQILGRVDHFDRGATDGTLLLAGLNVWPTAATQLQINYIVNTDDADPDRHRVLANFQVSF